MATHTHIQEISTCNRRAVVAGIATLPAIGIAATASAAETSKMAELIDAHKAASKANDDAYAAMEKIETARDNDRRNNPILAPVVVLPNGKMALGAYEFGPYTFDDICRHISKEHAELRKRQCSQLAQKMYPDLIDGIASAIDASEERAYKAAAEAAAEDIRRDEATGLPEATDRANEACAMEAEARAALTAHRPANAAEAKMKADYMESAASSWNYCWDEPGFREALVARLCEVA